MGKREVVDAVREYLQHAGCVELKQLWLGLEKRASLGEIRAALKAIGAVARVIGDWPKYASNGDRIPTIRHATGRDLPNVVDRFTVYSLAPVGA